MQWLVDEHSVGVRLLFAGSLYVIYECSDTELVSGLRFGNWTAASRALNDPRRRRR